MRDPVDVAIVHVVDSLTAVELLRSRGVESILDLGSGGGFPGLPLAVAIPTARALLVDSVVKKTRFLASAVDAVGLAGQVAAVADRAEALAASTDHRERWPAVLARAVTGLAELIELAFPLLRPGGILVAWKRGDLADELGAADRALPALGGGGIELLDTDLGGLLPGHRLVVVTKAGSTPNAYPRDPALRRRRPW